MAFQRRQQGGGNKPALSIQFSVKVGNEYEKSPNLGCFTNDGGGPAFRGKLKNPYLTQLIEFLTACADAGLEPSYSVFDNQQQQGGFKKPAEGGFKGGFKKPAFQKKPNPFKQPEEQQEDPGFGDE